MTVNWHREIAELQVLPIYQQMDGLVCVLLVGSTARNLQGNYSDIDLVLYWDIIPAEAQRISYIQNATGIIHDMGDSSNGETDLALQSQSDVFYLFGDSETGLKIDITHKTTNSAIKLIDDVVVGYETKRIKLAIIHSLQHSVVLQGEQWMNARHLQIGLHMPMGVCERLIEDNIRFIPLWIFDKFAERPDPILYHRFRSKNLDQMMMVLSAVNRLYMPDGFKHMDAFIMELQYQPENLARNIVQILDNDPETAKPIMMRLGDVIHDLVEMHMPQIKIQDARDFFHYIRPKHSHSPLITENGNNSNSTKNSALLKNMSERDMKRNT